MLTAAQIKKHWNTWRQVTDANDWVMDGGKLDRDALRESSHWHKLVIDRAIELALHSRCAVTAEDLRHACYVVATTPVPSSEFRVPSSNPKPQTRNPKPAASIKDLDNRSFSRVLVLFRLLIEPEDLDAACEWEDPQREERDRLIWRIEHSVRGSAYAQHLSGDMYGTKDWPGLPIERLRSLNRLIWARQRDQDQPVTANEPF